MQNHILVVKEQTPEESIGLEKDMNNKRVNSGITQVLYEDDAYAKECVAGVLECREILRQNGDKAETVYGIVLDRTVFFPEGGGQPADEGVLMIGDGSGMSSGFGTFPDEQLNGQSEHFRKVLDVQKTDGVILHYVSNPVEVGSIVTARLDWRLRYERMQNHSGEHLFCGLIHKLYGYENVGFHMSGDLVTVDVNGVLTAEDLAKLERLANEGVDANAGIKAVYPDSSEEMDYRSKLELTEDIRVVIIDGYDACACCAPHVQSTGEIGLIKVIDFMSHRGGTRFTLKSGKWAREDYNILHEEIGQVMRLFSSKREECHLAATRISEQLKVQHETISLLKKQITGLIMDRLREDIQSKPDQRVHMIFDEALDEVQMRTLINEGVALAPALVAGFMGKDGEGYRYIIGKNEEAAEPDLRMFAKEMNTVLNGRGGGSVKMIQGSVAATRAEIEAWMKAYE